MARTLLQASAILSVLLLLSRFSGLIREQMIAAQLGLGPEADATVLLLTLPDMLVSVLLAGGFSAALVPALSRAEPAERADLLQRIILWMTLGAIGLGLLLIIFRETVLGLLAPSLNPVELTNFGWGFALAVLVLPLSVVLGPVTAYLQVTRQNALPPLGVVVFNCVLVIYFAILQRSSNQFETIDFLTFGTVLVFAALLRLATLVPGVTPVLRRPIRRARFQTGFRRQFLQGVAAHSLVAATPIIFRSLQATGGPGNLAAFSFAERLFHLPVALLISPIMLFFLPILSRLSKDENAAFRSRVLLASNIGFAATLSAAIVLALFSDPISEIIFGYGRMQGADTMQVASSFRIFATALPAFALFQVMSAALNAQTRTHKVLQATILALVAGLGVFLVLQKFGLPPHISASWGFVSFHYAAAIFSTCFSMGKTDLSELFGQLSRTMFRCLVVMMPLLLLLNFLTLPESRLMNLFLILCTTLLMILVNLRVLLSLRSVRVDEGETSQ
ncbi:hypothetical protein E2K80_11725 [Rhodophyticola sp. CCM32]|uniref:lipid II flippase MurJ n=1 Tax=Rhodophyticola sp. CCM32 TaxID=2916397 RepID=UPI00107FBE73|nr:lipid II flippase MurJ [Rhodophyticola sp. CCM32]QBY01313.1 hypothetical protein E2K80_11725 [Rhodophyticola sp. CCM32]